MDRYRLERLLGEGAAAQVYRAVDLSLNRPVALKFLRAGARPLAHRRFLREAQTAARMSHPNIVQVYDAGETDGRFYLAMELVEGRTLDGVLRERPSHDELAGLLEKVARGVHHAHLHGAIHRDLKPANILVDPSGEPKVADFGLAHLVESETALTRTGSSLGTPLYMAPEQAEGRAKEISPATDVYALGAILYEGLTGRPPHQAQSLAELSSKIARETPTAPRRSDPGVPMDLETICLKALEKEPGRRYPTAEAFAEDLRRWREGEPILARPPSAWGRAVRKLRRHRTAAAAAVAALALISGAGALTLIQRGKATQAEEAKHKAEEERERMRAAAEQTTARLKRLATAWSGILERKRDLRLLKMPAEKARAELQQAVSEVDGHLREWPEDPAGLYVRARGRMYLGDLAGAKEDLRRALNRRPDFRPGWALLGMVLTEEYQATLWTGVARDPKRPTENEGLLTQATDAFAKGWRPGGESEEAARWGLPWTREDQVQERLAQAFEEGYVKSRPAEARRLLMEGLDQYQAEEYAYNLAWWVDDPRERRAWLDRAIQWAPGYAEALVARGNKLTQAGDFAGAIADFGRAIEIQSRYGDAFHNRGTTRIQQGDLRGAMEDVTRALELKGDYPEAYYNRGLIKAALGDVEGAIADYDRAIGLRGAFPDALASRGVAKGRLGNLEGAIADCTRALEIDPGFPKAWSNRGVAKVKLGDLAGGIADYDRALRLDDRDASSFYNRAAAKLNLGKPDEALTDFDRAIELRPGHVESYFHRADAKIRLGDVAGGAADYRKALELAPATWEPRAKVEEWLRRNRTD